MSALDIDESLKKLLKSKRNTKPIYLADSGWLEGKSKKEVKAIYREFDGKLQLSKAELWKSLGEPKWSLPVDRDWFDAWYPESLFAAAWERDGKVICLAVEHHDQETPVGLVLRCLTQEELDELSA